MIMLLILFNKARNEGYRSWFAGSDGSSSSDNSVKKPSNKAQIISENKQIEQSDGNVSAGDCSITDVDTAENLLLVLNAPQQRAIWRIWRRKRRICGAQLEKRLKTTQFKPFPFHMSHNNKKTHQNCAFSSHNPRILSVFSAVLRPNLTRFKTTISDL